MTSTLTRKRQVNGTRGDYFTGTTRWNRCKSTCGCGGAGKRRGSNNGCDCASGKCERGSKENRQMRAYALMVLRSWGKWDGVSSMATCPLTGQAFDLATGEVDRVNPSLGYVPNNIVMVSHAGNRERGYIQQTGGDMLGVARYVLDVASTSHTVPVMRDRDVASFMANVPASRKPHANEEAAHGSVNIVRGPYGTI